MAIQLSRKHSRIFVTVAVFLVLAMAAWTTYQIYWLVNDREAQEQIDMLREISDTDDRGNAFIC